MPCLAIEVPARSGKVPGIRRAVGRLGRRAELDADRVADVTLAVGEVCSIAGVHAYAVREPGPLRVTADITVHGPRVVVADEGRGMAPCSDSPGLGLGIPLMAALAITLEVHEAAVGGTEVWMEFAAAWSPASGERVRTA